MTEPALKHVTAAEYLEMERAATDKHEFYEGEIFTMPGATIEHNTIQMNFTGETRAFLKGKDCRVFGSDLRVHIPANGLYTYAGALIVCGKSELIDDEFDSVLNPVVLVEILSKSIQSYDRGDKFMLYRAIPSLKEYILIGSEFIGVEHYAKQNNGTWVLEELKDLSAQLYIQSIDFSIPLSQLYTDVEM